MAAPQTRSGGSFASMPLWADVWEELSELEVVAALLRVSLAQLGLGRAPADCFRVSRG